MLSVARVLPVDRPLYSKADLFEHRRNILRSARSFPQVSKRNHHRQVALLFRAFFENTKDSLDAYTIEGSGGQCDHDLFALRRDGRKRESMITIESLVNRHHCRQEKSHRLESVAFSSLAR